MGSHFGPNGSRVNAETGVEIIEERDVMGGVRAA
jgi:hypothetical protein